MLHMPGIIRSFPPLVADAFQMAKANDDFHFSEVPSTVPRNVDPWPLSLVRVPYKILYRKYTAVVLRLGDELLEVCLENLDLVCNRLLCPLYVHNESGALRTQLTGNGETECPCWGLILR
jgi:hypothetical protein